MKWQSASRVESGRVGRYDHAVVQPFHFATSFSSQNPTVEPNIHEVDRTTPRGDMAI